MTSSRNIIPPELAIKAMRDGGYTNTAYAIAELIDNSIQAEAKSVEVFCVEEEKTQLNQRIVRRISAIGVLDNGTGMDPDTLWLALQFGNGTHLTDRKGIGRFGMGLPNSSISQCRRVEVWTWQNGTDSAMYSYLDIDEIENGDLMSVPEPVIKKIPDYFFDASIDLGNSGTLVVWTKIDEIRQTWKGAQTTLNHTENLIGRMYRKFIDRGIVSIRMIAISDGNILSDALVRVNDPLYLMSDSTTPEPFADNPMFQKWGENDEQFEIEIEGKVSVVTVCISWARRETLTNDKSERGSKPYGKHAAKNVGVSIVREDRELELDNGWTNNEPTERWWGVEVNFPSTLDEIFGVTNNKQSATIFKQLAKYNIEEETNEGESFDDYKNRLKEQGDPRALLLEITNYIKRQLSDVRKRLKLQTEGKRISSKSGDNPSVDDLATTRFKERDLAGFRISTDNVVPREEDRTAIKNNLMQDKKFSELDAEKVTSMILRRQQKVKFFAKPMDGFAFFCVGEIPGGITTIEFNMNHPLYDQLISSLNFVGVNENTTELAKNNIEKDMELRLEKAADTIELLFAAWARYELEESNDKSDQFIEFRQNWGKMAKFFLTERNNDK